jgi:putative oxidoreductase
MAYGLLLIRIVFGLTLAAHGAQKLFGWFGGGGPQGTAATFEKMHFRTPLAMAALAGLSEFGGGILFAAGLLTPLAAVALTVVMLIAIATVHWPNGFWATKGGYEFNLSIIAVAIGVAVTGPGRISLDRAAGWDEHLSGAWWGAGVAAAAVVAALLTLSVARSHTLHGGAATHSR